MTEVVVPVRLERDKVRTIEITPPKPGEPPISDPRRLGIALVSLRIVPDPIDEAAVSPASPVRDEASGR